MATTNQDVVGEKCTRNDDSDLAFGDCAKKDVWKNFYSTVTECVVPGDWEMFWNDETTRA